MNTNTSSERKSRIRVLDAVILIAIVVVVLSVVSLLLINIESQLRNYDKGIASVLSSSNGIDHAALIGYLRSSDFAVMKISSLFISFLIILIGSLYILKVSESEIYFTAEYANIKTIFSTSSPGLAMVFLGMILVIASLNFTSSIDYKNTNRQTADKIKTEDLPIRKKTTKIQKGDQDE